MSSFTIIKGLPVVMNIHLTDESSNTAVDLNDGTWSVDVDMNYQTEKGDPVSFVLTPVPNGNVVGLSITREQTTTLNHLGTGYILTIRMYKLDDSAFIKNQIQVNVIDDL